VKVYFISGLAADRTIFRHITVPAACTAVYLDWISPLRDESLEHYALRLAEKIDDRKPFALVGLSLGGMMAVEIAKRLQPSHLILLSSISCVQHLPVYYRWARALSLHKAIPITLIQYASLLKRFFTNESPADKRLLRTMIRKSDAQFIKWSMNAVLNWKNREMPENVVHIHGTHDEILPVRYTKPTHLIPNGRHLMVLNNAAEINRLLHQLLAVPKALPLAKAS
jgi:pimeloyl-ACP methyl ester carboxylesterase